MIYFLKLVLPSKRERNQCLYPNSPLRKGGSRPVSDFVGQAAKPVQRARPNNKVSYSFCNDLNLKWSRPIGLALDCYYI